MPCYDKKLEASRPDFFLEQYNTREVDCVLTTSEVDEIFPRTKRGLFKHGRVGCRRPFQQDCR